MNSSKKGMSFIEEFKDFITFLQSLWGILAGISVFFPLSNALTNVIPVEEWEYDGGFAYSSSELVTGVATLIALFIILWTYSQRHKFKAQSERRLIQRQAGLSFAVGILALIIYLVGYFFVMGDFYENVLGWESDDPRYLLSDVILLLLYSAIFALMTKAFMLLGMIEYFGKES